MVISKGYKETDIGRLPTEWECVTIDELIDEISMGPFGSDITVSNFLSFGVPVLNGYNVSSEILKDYFVNFVTPQKAKSLKKAVAHRGDIIVTHRGTLGQISVIPNDSMYSEYVISQSQFRVRLKKEKANPLFIVLFFHSSKGQKYLLEGKGHTGVPALAQPTTTFRKLRVPLPAVPEQNAIVDAFSDVDELIDSLENLIEKKKAIKQGAMQELLTGKKRLPGFDGEWTEQYLFEIGVFLKGKGLPKSTLANEGFPCILYGEIFTTYNNEIKKILSKTVTKEGLISQKGDVLLPCSTTTKGLDLAKAVFLRTDGILLGSDIIVIRNLFKAYDPYFLAAILSNTYRNQIAEIAQGITIMHLNASKLKNIRVMFPPTIDEQQAIATILSDMDTEIETLTHKLKKSLQMKQGMMQELLTGRIRLLDTATQKQKKTKAVKTAKPESSQQGHNEHFHEAVILSTVVSLFANEQFPLGRFRRQKLAYLLHRHAQESTQGFLKKAAGPYNPTIRYKDENIALKANYVSERGKGKFLQGEKINDAVDYFVQWYGTETIEWLKQFQYRKNDDLEVLTTVAEATVDLKKSNLPITVESVKQIIRGNPEWAPKLDKDCFSDFEIQAAIKESQKLFA